MTDENQPPLKRRKLLSVQKPFRSPMRTPLKSSINTTTQPSEVAQSPLQQSISISGDLFCQQEEDNTASGGDGMEQSRGPPIKTVGRQIGRPMKRSSLGTAAAVNHIRQLESRNRNLNRENDQLKQALSILRSNKDAELQVLIAKWRSAAQQAADEVYGATRDKVNRMGGMEGLREQQRRKDDMHKQWEDEDRRLEVERRIKQCREQIEDGQATGDDLERLVAQFEEQNEQQAKDKEEAAARQKESSGSDKDDESYTMGTMLKQMRIDFSAIGYSPERQCWE